MFTFLLSLQYEWSSYFTGRKFKQSFNILGQIAIGVATNQISKGISKATDNKDNKGSNGDTRDDSNRSDSDGNDSGKSDSGGSDSGRSDSGGGWWGKRKK